MRCPSSSLACGNCGFGCVIGYVPVGLVGILIFQIYVTAVSGVMAMLKDSRVWMGITCLIFFHILVISTAINYLLCVFLDPGFVPYAWQPSDEMGPVIRARTDAEAVGELLNPRTMIMDQEGTCQARQDNRRYCHECKVSVHRSTYMCHSLLQRSVEREVRDFPNCFLPIPRSPSSQWKALETTQSTSLPYLRKMRPQDGPPLRFH